MAGHSYAVTDGTTTFSLTSTNSMVVSPGYTPAATSGDGTVTETFPLWLYGASVSALQTAIAALQQLLNTAKLRNLGVGPPLFLTVQLSGDASAWRSRILDARLDLGQTSLQGIGQAAMEAALYIERVPYFEGAEVELNLSANGQAAATGGRTIYNDPANGNWVQIAASELAGNLPAPIRLQLTNTIGSAQNYLRVLMSVNAYSDPANLVHYLQGEARLSGGTPTADGTCSGGSKLAFTAVGSPVFAWTLPAADMQRTKGARARLLARFAYSVGDLYCQPQIRDAAGSSVLWKGDELNIGPAGGAGTGGFYQDLGVIPLPPGGYGASWDVCTLALVFRGTAVVELDVLQLSMLDSFRNLDIAATSVANNAAIVHDGIAEITYVLSSGAWTPLATAFGGPLMLWPNMLQRIHIVHNLSASAPITNTWSVRAYHRPRRSTV